MHSRVSHKCKAVISKNVLFFKFHDFRETPAALVSVDFYERLGAQDREQITTKTLTRAKD